MPDEFHVTSPPLWRWSAGSGCSAGRSVGSNTSQMSDSVVCAKNGSITAVSQSGISVMSDSLIAFQPAMEEPSNIVPSVRKSSSTIDRSKVTCCHLPRGSVKRRSTNLTSFSVMSFRMVFGLAMSVPSRCRHCPCSKLDCVRAGFAGADADGLLDVEDEDFAVADLRCARPSGWRRAPPRAARRQRRSRASPWQEIDDVFSAAIELGMTLLAAEPAGFDNSDALDSDLLERVLHLIELEGLMTASIFFKPISGTPPRSP